MISLVTIATPTAGGAKSTNATDAIVFSVPGAPRGKARPQARAFMGKVQRFKDSKTVAYESLVRLAASEAMERSIVSTIPCLLRLTYLLSRSLPLPALVTLR